MLELLQRELNPDTPLFILVDRLVLGAAVLLVGAAVSLWVERVKLRLALRSEHAKQRVVHIGVVWSVVYESESATRELLRRVSQVIAGGGGVGGLQTLLPLEEESRKKAELVREAADANRFWLDEVMYHRVQRFHSSQMGLVQAFADGNLDALQKGEELLDKLRMSISDFR